MSMMYCSSCDRMLDTDYECDGCNNCCEEGKLWCWVCSRGFTAEECNNVMKCPRCGEEKCINKYVLEDIAEDPAWEIWK